MRLLVLVPLRVEAVALGSRPGWTVLRSGMGPARARIAAARGLAVDADAVAVAGLCAAAAPGLAAGDVVVATELRGAGAAPAAVDASLADPLRSRGVRVHAGPLHSADHVVGPDERRRLHAEGAIAVDMESAWLAAAAGGRPLAVLRVVVEAANRRLLDPRTPAAGVRALRNLRRAAGALDEWAATAAPAAAREADMVRPA